ncbi:hypothetical protein ABTM19_21255, partial [Acinetobacter baumannii]
GFVTALKAKAGGLFREIKTFELYDGAVTVAGVNKALQELADTADSQDTVLIYLSGHGEMVGENYFFIPQDFDIAGLDTD